MSGTSWAKFFWSDWSNDPTLKLCSFAAQGLWMRCLCIAAESQPVGYLAVNGKALDAPTLAKLAGGEAAEVSRLLGELDQQGVFSRDTRGCIYSRRMVRDAQRYAEARKYGKMGGNPSLRKDLENPPPLNPTDKPRFNGGVGYQKPYSKKPLGAAAPPGLGSGPAGSAKVFVEHGSAEWDAWIAYRKLTKQSPPPVTDNKDTRKSGWFFPSEFPPSFQAKEASR